MIAVESFLVGLVGTGTTASLSPALHMVEGAELGLSYVFRPIDFTALRLSDERLAESLDWAERLGYNAVTVTHPFKQQVLQHLDEVDPTASALGAVNTVLLTPTGRVGYNTDTTGFEAAFRAGMGDVSVGSVVQLGAGGAGTAVADALCRIGAEELTLIDIDEARAAALATELRHRHGIDVRSAPRTELQAHLAAAQGVVHCTPKGMHDHPGTPFDTALLRPDLWVSDIVYRPLETELVRAARAVGCRTLAGGRMAVYQAADAIRLITGVQPNAERMMQHFGQLVADEQADA
jgi:shikimate dehydrogenase